MPFNYNDFILSISSSLIASIIFLFILLIFLRPRVKIASSIYLQKDIFENTTRDCYIFKIINLSYFSAYDISLELCNQVTYPVKDGINYRYFPLKLKTNHLNFVAPYKPRWYKKDYGKYAMLFISYENISEIIENERNSIKIQVTLKHGLTGLTKVFSAEFVSISDIRKGHFAFGNNININ
jgi:hypothetical protein